MPKLIMPKDKFKELLRYRRECGSARFDEVWNGVYVVSPNPDNEHQGLGFLLCSAIHKSLERPDEARLFPGCNVSDDSEDWTKNYRIPDVAIFLPGNPAEDRDTHWLGGPDFAVEIISRGDRSRKKLDFYAKVKVKELMLVDRKPWKLELYRRDGMDWVVVGTSDLSHPNSLSSQSLAVAFRLVPGRNRPQIEVARPTDGRTWLA